MESGHSRDLGEEECPASNPNQDFATNGEETEEGRENAPARLAALLLEGEGVGTRIEETAEREGYGRWMVLRAEADEHLDSLGSVVPHPIEEAALDITCSGLLLYQSCPLHYRFRYLDGLPERPSPAAAFGQEVHRRIEELSLVGAGSPSEDLAPDEENAAEVEDRDEELWVAAGSERASELRPNRLEEMVARYRESVYGRRAATHAELLVELPLLTGTLRGRVDRLDRLPEGCWEMVDFKTGAPSAEATSYYRQQLATYALALRDGWRIPARSISAHLFFLHDGTDLEFTFDDAELDQIRDQAEAAMLAIREGQFPAVRGEQRCRWCDYGHLCKLQEKGCASDRSFVDDP